MNQVAKEFVQICTQTLPIAEPIYEFGSLQVPKQIGFSDLRPLFPDKQFIGSDIRHGPGVDIILDLENIALPDKTVGTALCICTLEHVEHPRKAIREIHRVTQLGGIVIIVVPFFFKIHNYPKDYWRFTPDCLKSLLKQFPNIFVSSTGIPKRPHTVVGIGFNGPEPPLDKFFFSFHNWQKNWIHRRPKLKNPLTTYLKKLLFN